MKSKIIIVFIGVMLICLSFTVKAIEDIVLHTMPAPNIIPYDFVVDAGSSAQKYVKSPLYRNLFIYEYSATLKEIIFYKMKITDFDENERECKRSKDENYRASTCSRVAAAKAVFEKKIPLNIQDFGFVKKSFLGRIKKVDHGHGNFLVLETTDGDKWECILDEDIQFSENILYTIEGLLGPEGAYGDRGNLLKREFLVIQLVKYKNT